MTRRAGMTLVEVLVAMLVFALVAAAAAGSLRLAANARDQLTAADRRTSDLEIARLLIREDLAQIVERRTRDEFGATFGPAFLGGIETRTRPPVAGETLLAAFVRGGWANPDFEAPRSSLQSVEYLVRGDAVIRRTRPFLDDARGQPRTERQLLAGVSDVAIRFLDARKSASGDPDAGWSAGWPIPGAPDADAPPRAVSIAFTTKRYGALRMAFWVGETGGPELPRDNASADDKSDTEQKGEEGDRPAEEGDAVEDVAVGEPRQ